MALGMRSLEDFDVAGIAATEPTWLPNVPDVNPRQVQAYLDALRQKYSPERVDTLQALPALVDYDRNGDGQMRRLWWELIIRYPRAYLSHRLAFDHWLFFPPDPGQCLPFYVGVDGPPDMIARLGLQRGVRPGDQALFDYGKAFLTTPMYWNGAWVLLAIALGIGFIKRRRSDFPIICLLAASTTFAATFLIAGIACDVRYCYFVPVSVAVALARLTQTAESHNH